MPFCLSDLTFQEIYQTYASMVYNVCLNYFGNEADAQDCTQDVFIKIHKKLDTFKEESSHKTWIYKITTNTCLDKIKATKRRRKLYELGSFLGLKYEPITYEHPGVELEQKEAVNRIMTIINDLPEKQRTAIILKRLENLSQKEIADIMNCSTKAVESLVSRAKNTIKRKLNEGY